MRLPTRESRPSNMVIIHVSRQKNGGFTVQKSGRRYARLNRSTEWMAEREGFEPSIRFCRILTFQASAFDHSATAPHFTWKAGI